MGNKNQSFALGFTGFKFAPFHGRGDEKKWFPLTLLRRINTTARSGKYWSSGSVLILTRLSVVWRESTGSMQAIQRILQMKKWQKEHRWGFGLNPT
jgi:hypothetical protein